MVGHQVAEQQGPWAALKLEDTEGTILNARRTLVHVGLAFNVAHHPGTFVIAEQVAVHIGLVRTVVGQAITAKTLDQVHRANRALGDQVFGQRIGGQKAPLMGNHQLDPTAPTRHQHLFSGPECIGHWLLAEDRLRAMRGSGNCPRCMAAMPGADRNHVELFFFEHFARISVMIS